MKKRLLLRVAIIIVFPFLISNAYAENWYRFQRVDNQDIGYAGNARDACSDSSGVFVWGSNVSSWSYGAIDTFALGFPDEGSMNCDVTFTRFPSGEIVDATIQLQYWLEFVCLESEQYDPIQQMCVVNEQAQEICEGIAGEDFEHVVILDTTLHPTVDLSNGSKVPICDTEGVVNCLKTSAEGFTYCTDSWCGGDYQYTGELCEPGEPTIPDEIEADADSSDTVGYVGSPEISIRKSITPTCIWIGTQLVCPTNTDPRCISLDSNNWVCPTDTIPNDVGDNPITPPTDTITVTHGSGTITNQFNYYDQNSGVDNTTTETVTYGTSECGGVGQLACGTENIEYVPPGDPDLSGLQTLATEAFDNITVPTGDLSTSVNTAMDWLWPVVASGTCPLVGNDFQSINIDGAWQTMCDGVSILRDILDWLLGVFTILLLLKFIRMGIPS